LIGTRGDTAALTTGLNMHMGPVGVASTTGAGVASTTGAGAGAGTGGAYKWTKHNWKTIRTMTSRKLPLPRILPRQENTKQWMTCLQRVLKEQTGLSWRTLKHGTTLTCLSMWSKLGINVQKYMAWCCSPHAPHFGIIQQSIQCCNECDGEEGADVLCVRQKGVWRCTTPHSSALSYHRQPFEPLDVHAGWQVEKQEHDNDEQEEHDNDDNVNDTALIDRLVGHLGFECGITLGGPGVSAQEMKLAWSTAIIKQEDVEALFKLYTVHIDSASTKRRLTRHLQQQIGVILRTIGIQLQLRRPRTGKQRCPKHFIAAL
jgi:hypothetical protein